MNVEARGEPLARAEGEGLRESRMSLAEGERILASQPFSVFLGARLTRLALGEAEIELAIGSDHLQQHGFVHGGVIGYLADNALGFAGGTYYGNGLSAEYKLAYLRPALGETLIARAQAIHAGKRQAVCRCDVYIVAQGEEKICATALGTIANVQTPLK